MVKVMSFNIRCCDDPDGNSIAERSERLKKITLPISPDIIGLQEMRPKWEPYILDIYGDEYDMVNIYRAKNELESTPILWKKAKYECVEVNRFWFSDTPDVESKGWDEKYDCYRMCVHLKLRDRENGNVINFINTHFGFGDNCQVSSVNLIKEFCNKIQNEPICIVGDFNMEPDSKGYSEMIRTFTDVNAVTSKDWKNTYHGYDLNNPNGKLIDYCFVNNQILPNAREVIDDTLEGKFPSDHFGLIMLLSIK